MCKAADPGFTPVTPTPHLTQSTLQPFHDPRGTRRGASSSRAMTPSSAAKALQVARARLARAVCLVSQLYLSWGVTCAGSSCGRDPGSSRKAAVLAESWPAAKAAALDRLAAARIADRHGGSQDGAQAAKLDRAQQ